MQKWRNSSGRPLSSTSWLEAHHLAKLPERKLFADSLVRLRPRQIVDLGCGPGLWLALLNEIAPSDCELIGVDSDALAIEEARARSEHWNRPVRFLNMDLDRDYDGLPSAEMFLAFNFFPYLTNPASVIKAVKQKLQNSGVLVVRQYDGALLRFGPLDQRRRSRMDTSLEASVLGSRQFRHYDLDNTYELLAGSSFREKEIKFELFQRTSPYPAEFIEYMVNTIEWTIAHTAEDISAKLRAWLSESAAGSFEKPSYFVETDLVGWLS